MHALPPLIQRFQVFNTWPHMFTYDCTFW
jgi:hypothetical protein